MESGKPERADAMESETERKRTELPPPPLPLPEEEPAARSLLLRARHRIEWLPVALAGLAVGLLPRRVRLGLGTLGGALAYYLMNSRRRTAGANLEIAFPEKSAAERKRINRAHFRHFGRVTAEVLASWRYTKETISRAAYCLEEDLARLQGAAAKGKGVVFAHAHLGNWELGGLLSGWLPIPRVTTVARRLENPHLDLLLDSRRGRSGSLVVGRRGSARAILGALREGGIVSLLMDQSTAPFEGAYVPFFGLPALTSHAAATLSLRLGAPVVVGAFLPDADGRLRFIVEPEIEFEPTGDRGRDTVALLAAINARIERLCRERPEAYLWGHRRWKYRPTEELGRYPLYSFYVPYQAAVGRLPGETAEEGKREDEAPPGGSSSG